MAARWSGRGIYPPTHKDATRSAAVRIAPLKGDLVIPVVQHIGVANVPLVSVGQRVARGQAVASSDEPMSAPVHSPVGGEVIAVSETQTVAGTPTAIKIDSAIRRSVTTLVINGCECEPFLTCDHRLMLEQFERVFAGARAIAAATGAYRIVLAIEADKHDAIDPMRARSGGQVEVLKIPVRYPSGAEKMLVKRVTGREVPSGELPMTVGALVHNVATVAAVADSLERGRPLMERIVTVAGAVLRPGNYPAPIGMSVSDLLEAAGGATGAVGRVIAGGPMTGAPLADTDAPVVKTTSAIVALSPYTLASAVRGGQVCVRCAYCVSACPMSLEPCAIGTHANTRSWLERPRCDSADDSRSSCDRALSACWGGPLMLRDHDVGDHRSDACDRMGGTTHGRGCAHTPLRVHHCCGGD